MKKTKQQQPKRAWGLICWIMTGRWGTHLVNYD